MAEEPAVSALLNGKLTHREAQQACAAGRLSDDGTAFLEEHRIRGYEVGPDQQTSIVTMANLLQVTSEHPALCFTSPPHMAWSSTEHRLACTDAR